MPEFCALVAGNALEKHNILCCTHSGEQWQYQTKAVCLYFLNYGVFMLCVRSRKQKALGLKGVFLFKINLLKTNFIKFSCTIHYILVSFAYRSASLGEKTNPILNIPFILFYLMDSVF